MSEKPTSISLLQEYVNLSKGYYPITRKERPERLIHLEKCFLGQDLTAIALDEVEKLKEQLADAEAAASIHAGEHRKVRAKLALAREALENIAQEPQSVDPKFKSSSQAFKALTQLDIEPHAVQAGHAIKSNNGDCFYNVAGDKDDDDWPCTLIIWPKESE